MKRERRRDFITVQCMHHFSLVLCCFAATAACKIITKVLLLLILLSFGTLVVQRGIGKEVGVLVGHINKDEDRTSFIVIIMSQFIKKSYFLKCKMLDISWRTLTIFIWRSDWFANDQHFLKHSDIHTLTVTHQHHSANVKILKLF